MSKADPAPSDPTAVHIAALGELIRRSSKRGPDHGASTPGRVLLHTLMMTRWVAVVGQLFAILFVHISLGIPLPLPALLPAVALSAVVNLGLAVRYKATTRLPERSALLLFAYDLCQLAYLLALTGGIQNPFAALVLVPVALSAATLSLRATAAISLLGLVGLAGLALWPEGLPWRQDLLVLPPLYRVALWAGLCIATLLLATFVWSIAEEARRRADALSVTQLALAREQEMSALGGQAAAVAHMLGTPLGTINIIAKELVRELPDGSPLAEDAAELLAQAQRCRELLRGLGRPERRDKEHAPFTGMPFAAHLESIAAELERPGIEVQVQVAREDGQSEPSLVLRPEVRHSLSNLIDNAIRFARQRVTLSLIVSRSGLGLVVEDDGPGFPPEALDWLGEPFLSTGRDDGGLGLGIFIANTLLARTGASIHFSNVKSGARVTIDWPRSALDRGQLGMSA